MIIVMDTKATKKDLDDVVARIKKMGFTPHIVKGVERTIIGAIGDASRKAQLQSLESLHHVEKVMPILKPFKLASREFHLKDSVVKVGKQQIGGKKIALIAGPCSVESEAQISLVAKAVKQAGAGFLRGGAFKPRTSPYAFQGMGEEGLKLLQQVGKKYSMPIVTEVMNPRDVDLVARYADVIQIGARNVQNFSLLKEVGQVNKPILLKRGMSTTIEEFLMSAEYILAQRKTGEEYNVILCERGIRTFETATRNTLDLSAVPVLKKLTHLPIVIDPSHAVGYWDLVAPMAKASVAAGADGLLIEVHNCPEEAMSDGPQSLKPKKFDRLVKELKPIAKAVGRSI